MNEEEKADEVAVDGSYDWGGVGSERRRWLFVKRRWLFVKRRWLFVKRRWQRSRRRWLFIKRR